MQPENPENTTPQSDVSTSSIRSEEMPRRDLNDPDATFEDLPFKPQLTEKQSKRMNQTFKGMIFSIGFCILVFIPLYLLNPQPSAESFKSSVDLQATAQQAGESAGFEPFAPELPENSYANFARWQTNATQGVPFWEFGVVASETKFVWVRQAAEANATWIALTTDGALPSGTQDVDGTQWEVRTKDETTYMISERQDTTFIISSDTGTEELLEIVELAERGVK